MIDDLIKLLITIAQYKYFKPTDVNLGFSFILNTFNFGKNIYSLS